MNTMTKFLAIAILGLGVSSQCEARPFTVNLDPASKDVRYRFVGMEEGRRGGAGEIGDWQAIKGAQLINVPHKVYIDIACGDRMMTIRQHHDFGDPVNFNVVVTADENGNVAFEIEPTK
jgi:hypothetical protein